MSIAPMHTAEHILNQTMVRMFGCKRSRNAHIERKKSKCDYSLATEPTAEQIAEIENKVREMSAGGSILNEEDFELDEGDEDDFDIRTVEDDE